jgi:hypothetical protein
MLDQITDVCIHPLTLPYSKLSQKLGLERSEVIWGLQIGNVYECAPMQHTTFPNSFTAMKCPLKYCKDITPSLQHRKPKFKY